MIDSANHRIYVDYSTLATFLSCKEKCRLGNTLGYQPRARRDALTFGHAFHAGLAAYYDSLAGGYHDAKENWHRFDIQHGNHNVRAKAAFLRDMGIEGSELPVTLESGERQSTERGLAMLDAYIYRWQSEPYDNILDNNREPLTEVGFRYYLCDFEGWPVYYVGYIDRIMLNRATQRPVVFETKTTSQGLDVFILQCKPNHQVTGYFPAAQAIISKLGYSIPTECVWDCAFVSSRRPDMQAAAKQRFALYGVDPMKDFKRQTTQRSRTDITEFLLDAENTAVEYCKWITASGVARWPRTAPGACHAYGGCQFRQVCMVNGDVSLLETDFEKKPWRPWERILTKENVIDIG